MHRAAVGDGHRVEAGPQVAGKLLAEVEADALLGKLGGDLGQDPFEVGRRAAVRVLVGRAVLHDFGVAFLEPGPLEDEAAGRLALGG